MTTYTCTCKVHADGVSFSAPEYFMDGLKGKSLTEAIHNYTEMVRNPIFGRRLAAQGVKAV